MRRLALKIDVATLRGALIGVPRLVEALRHGGAQATFCFNLGPDRSGRALPALLADARPGTSVLARHGLATWVYGTLLPAPDIGRRCGDIARRVRAAGFEVGVLSWEATCWRQRAACARPAWTEQRMRAAWLRHQEIFGEAPRLHAAAGWQSNPHALRLTQRLGFGFASDCRGTHPFIPVWHGELVLCPQLPTTLPPCDELLGEGGDADGVHERLLALTAHAPACGHVYTARAELEGQQLLPAFVKLLAGWRAQGYALVTLGALFETLDAARLPRHELVRGTVAHRAGSLMLQGPEFPPAA